MPGAAAWLEAARHAQPGRSGLFLGVGDPIYNSADGRLAAAARRPALHLARLVASGPELDACARAWGGDPVLLTGAGASRRGLAEQLKRDPDVIHFATHVLESSGTGYGLIALSIDGRGEAEVLPPPEIAHWRTSACLVVLSGCHSAAGAMLPGTGLLGLTRACWPRGRAM